MATPRRRPGEDRPVAPGSDLRIITAISEARHEADMARRSRLQQNKQNMAMFLGQQDWSHKHEGQSTEFLPKVPTAVQQLSAFISRALIQFGDWYSMDFNEQAREVLKPEDARKLLNCFLESLPHGDMNRVDFRMLVADAIKVGALESLIVFKIHGRTFNERRFVAERGNATFDARQRRFVTNLDELEIEDIEVWRLMIDLVRPEDWYPDPSGNGLYQIHRVERDLHEVIDAAEAGVYDMDAVNAIEEDFTRELSDRRPPHKQDQDEAQKPGYRKKVVIDEFWGTLLRHDGKIAERNVLVAIANDKHLIRPPEPNPFWHQESPFVACPMSRVPFSVWHKALFDHASSLNIAINEMFNLMLDGGIAAVWGTRQLRVDELENPADVSNGIPQGKTLAVKSTLPVGSKVLETVTDGQVPNDAMNIFEALTAEFVQSALTNEIKLGQLPPRQVLATEVVEASQSQAVTLDDLAGNLENNCLAPVLRKSFLTIIQNLDDLSVDQVIAAIGQRNAFKLIITGKARLFSLFGSSCQFKVNGLSATLSRVRDFQKTMALLAAVTSNPLMFQAFLRRFSPTRMLDTLMRQLNINPDTLLQDADEQATLQDRIRELPGIQSLLNPQRGGTENQGGAGLSAQQVGEPSLPAEINQSGNPTSGLGAG